MAKEKKGFCCDRLKFFIEKEAILFEENEYYLVWNDWSTTNALDEYELIFYCPFCGADLEI